MKKKSLLFLLFCLALALFFGCKKDEEDEPIKDSILPKWVSIDIPEAISNSAGSKKCTYQDIEPIPGDSLYEMLRVFIHIGEASADLVSEIMNALSQHDINQAMTFSYISDEDGRTKNCVVVENVTVDGSNYEFKLTITDQDGNNALQVIWNRNPIEGITIIQPYNCNRTEPASLANLIYKVEYSEVGDMGFDKHMIVTIAGAPKEDDFYINNLKMFVGKTGDIIDVYGNSNHPDAVILTTVGGLNWAFVARGDDVQKIGVAKVGLPSCIYEYNLTDSIFGPYSLENVLRNEITAYWEDSVSITPTQLDSIITLYIQNAQAPGYFGNNGFVSCATPVPTNPAGFTTEFIDLSGLTPYKPKDINDLVIEFY